MKRIESEQNKIIRLVRSLSIKKHRQEHKLFLAEGERLVRDGLAKSRAEFLVISESFLWKEPESCPVYQVPDPLFLKLTDTKSPQGILGVFPMIHQDLKKLSKGNTLLLNSVSDPGNLGTLLRTAEAAGFYHVILDRGCADLYNPKTVRSTMSALFDLNLYLVEHLTEGAKVLEQLGIPLFGAALSQNSKNLYKLSIPIPFGLVIGNEARGIESSVLALCHEQVQIPIIGRIESLNAAIAGGIIMYEAVRREYFEKG